MEKKNFIYIPPRVICEIGAKATGGQNHRALFGKVLALLLVDHSAHGAGLGHQLLDLGLVDDAGQVAALGNPGAISEPRANCLKKMWKAIRGNPRKMIFLGWVHIYVRKRKRERERKILSILHAVQHVHFPFENIQTKQPNAKIRGPSVFSTIWIRA